MLKYLRCVYEDGGRGPVRFDCWGLVRHVRHVELGFKLLPEFGSLRNTDPRGFTRAYECEAGGMERCEAEHGAIAAVLVGKICVHVGLVIECDGRLRILEMNPKRGARFIDLCIWLPDHNTVTFHRDRHD